MNSPKKLKATIAIPMLGACLALLLYFVFNLGPAAGKAAALTIIYVDADSAAVSPDGASWATAYTKLQDGLDAAGNPAEGDLVEIWVANGIYYPDEGATVTNNSQFASFAIPSRVQLYGGFAGNEDNKADRDWESNLSILSGDITQNDTVDSNGITLSHTDVSIPNTGGIIKISDGGIETVLDGFTITGGYIPAARSAAAFTQGGSLSIQNSSPLLRNLNFYGSLAQDGAGIYIENLSTPTEVIKIENVLIEGSRAEDRGGGLISVSANLEVDGLTVRNNYAFSNGGGLWISGGSSSFKNLNVQGNTSRWVGGGIYQTDADLTFENFLIEENVTETTTAWGGGGMLSYGPNLTLLNGTFRGNQSGRRGGGLYVVEGRAILTNIVISGNKAILSAGGAHFSNVTEAVVTNITVTGNEAAEAGGVFSNSSTALFQNSIFWGNVEDLGAGSMRANFTHPETSTPIIWFSNIEGSGGSDAWADVPITDGGNNIDIDPQFMSPISASFAPTITGNYKPISTSVVIDLGLTVADLDGPLPMTQTIQMIETDVAGDPRWQNLAVDLGAYENTPMVSLISPLDTNLREGGDGISVTIRLAEDPPPGRRNIVTVPLRTSNDQCEVSIDTAILSSASWQDGVTFTVSAVDDREFDGTQPCILLSDPAEADAAAFSGIDTLDVLFNVADNDLPGVEFVTPTLSVAEGVTFTMPFTVPAAPAVAMDVTASSRDANCIIQEPTSVTITPSNWADGGSFTVTSFSDQYDLPDQSCFFELTVFSSDPAYVGYDGVDGKATVINDDTAAIISSSTTLTIEEGMTETITLTLDAQPTDSILITPTVSAPECTLSPADSISIDAEDWSSEFALTVSAVEDQIDASDASCLISLTITTDDGAYATVLTPEIEVTVQDNDTAEIKQLDSALSVPEAGDQAIAPFSLLSEPTAPVTLNFSIEGDCTISPSQLVFDETNWDVVQSLVITPQSEDIDCFITSTVSSEDLIYEGFSGPTFTVSVSPTVNMVFLPLIQR